MKKITWILIVLILAVSCGEPGPDLKETESALTDLENFLEEDAKAKECTAEFNAFIDQYNALSEDERRAYSERSATYDGWEVFATENTIPLTLEEYCK
jgi:hypothetical protein